MVDAGRALEQDVMSRSREWLVPLLYEHLLVNLRRASDQIAARDYEGKAVSLEKASAILFELLAMLDFERGGELASRLAALYSYFAGEVGTVGRTLDTALLARLIQMIASLHESWTYAAAATSPRASTVPGTPA